MKNLAFPRPKSQECVAGGRPRGPIVLQGSAALAQVHETVAVIPTLRPNEIASSVCSGRGRGTWQRKRRPSLWPSCIANTAHGQDTLVDGEHGALRYAGPGQLLRQRLPPVTHLSCPRVSAVRDLKRYEGPKRRTKRCTDLTRRIEISMTIHERSRIRLLCRTETATARCSRFIGAAAQSRNFLIIFTLC